MSDPNRLIPGPDPGACDRCGGWRKAGMVHDCEAALDESEARVGSERLVRQLGEMFDVIESIRADMLGMPKFLEPTHAGSLGRLSGKLEELRRETTRTMWLADYMARTITR